MKHKITLQIKQLHEPLAKPYSWGCECGGSSAQGRTEEEGGFGTEAEARADWRTHAKL